MEVIDRAHSVEGRERIEREKTETKMDATAKSISGQLTSTIHIYVQ